MQNIQIVTSKIFKNELNRIFNYATDKSQKYFQKYKRGISNYIDTLKVFPYIGRRVIELPNKEYRERIYKNYRIVYQPFERKEYVYINFIAHAKQDFLKSYSLYLKEENM